MKRLLLALQKRNNVGSLTSFSPNKGYRKSLASGSLPLRNWSSKYDKLHLLEETMKFRLLAIVVATAALFPTLSQAATLISPSGVSPSDGAFPNVGDRNIFVGRVNVFCTAGRLFCSASPSDGSITINSDPGETEVTTERQVTIGGLGAATGFAARGEVTVDGGGVPGGALLRTGQSIQVGGSFEEISSNVIGTPLTENAGEGRLTVQNGGVVSTGNSDLGGNGFAGVEIARSAASSDGDVETEGVVNIAGAGSLLETGGIAIGNDVSGATGILSVSNGGQVVSSNVSFGQAFGDLEVTAGSSVEISGNDSSLIADSLLLGSSNRAFGDTVVINRSARLDILDGASASVGRGFFGASVGVGTSGVLVVSGTGSELNVSSDPSLLDFDSLEAGNLLIGQTGLIYDDDFNVRQLHSGSGFVVIDDGAQLTVEKTVHVGGGAQLNDPFVEGNPNLQAAFENLSSSGKLTVSSGGRVSAESIIVHQGGELDGDGGTLTANVVLDGGIIAPGASPGIMNIDGDLEILDGLLQIEIAGTGAGMFDQLNVTGDLIASSGFDIEISFLDSFVPQEGDIFNFLNVDGDSSIFDTPSLIDFSVKGGGFFGNNPQLDFASGSLSLISDTSVAPVPLPAGFPMLLAGFAGLGWLGSRRKAVSAT